MAEETTRPIELTDDMRMKFNAVSTATLAGQMQKRGMRNSFLNGLKPLALPGTT